MAAPRSGGPLFETGLLIISAALFSCSFPNPINIHGFGVLGWICLVPALWVVNRCPWPRLFAYAPVWGLLSLLLSNYWLGAYHPLGLVLGGAIIAVWYLVLCLVLRLARHLFPQGGLWVQVLVWLAYESLRIQGFLCFPYGNLAYSQFENDMIRGSASLWGIWGIDIIMIMVNVGLAWFLSLREPSIPALAASGAGFGKFLRNQGLFAGAAGLLLVSALAWSCLDRTVPAPERMSGMILVQQNVDPWIGGFPAYQESLRRLLRQSEKGLAEHPDARMVIWAETSFVPAIEWHDRFRQDPDKYALVQELKDFSRKIQRPLVLGNGDAIPYANEKGAISRKDYNAVLVMNDGRITGRYHKNRLVPFTEFFPYRKELPWVYQLLVENDTSFWEPGTDLNLLEADGIRFGSPICFEDSFPDISRHFAGQGAQILVNLSNDSWSKSVPGAMQHLAMAVFRSAENHLPMVRSTNGGMSVLVDSRGRILAMNEAFTESFLHVEVPVSAAPDATPARRAGEVPVYILDLLCGLILLAGLVRKGIGALREQRNR